MSRRNIGLALLVLVFGAASFTFAIGNSDAGDGGDGEGQDVAAGEAPFIGLTRDEAMSLAEEEGRPWRLGRLDDEWLAVTADYVVGRVTFEIDDGIVTVATIEQTLDDVDDPGRPATQEQRDSADVLAAAVLRLLTIDHGFGVGTPAPFTRVHIGEALGGRGGTPLEPLQLERIAAAVNETGATMQYLDDPHGLIQALFNGAPQGTAVITIDALRLQSGRGEVELRLWCGSLCAVFLTYEAVLEGGEWTITGTVGPIAMS